MSDSLAGVNFYAPAIAANQARQQRAALLAQRLMGQGPAAFGGGGQVAGGGVGTTPATTPTAASSGGLDMQALAAAFRSQDAAKPLPADFDTNKFALSKPEASGGGMSGILDAIGGLFGSAKGAAAGG